MVETEKFALAARLYVLLKRKTGRSIDAAHIINNLNYARDVIADARTAHDPDLDPLLDRFEKELFGKISPRPAPVMNGASAVAPAVAEATPAAIPGKYVGMLR